MVMARLIIAMKIQMQIPSLIQLKVLQIQTTTVKPTTPMLIQMVTTSLIQSKVLLIPMVMATVTM